MQYSAWFFKDSFDNPAGGLVLGPKFDFFKIFSLGMVGGLYFRKRPCTDLFGDRRCFNKLPLSYKTKDKELASMVGITTSFELPITDTMGLETNCLINGIVNNCQLGLKFSF